MWHRYPSVTLVDSDGTATFAEINPMPLEVLFSAKHHHQITP